MQKHSLTVELFFKNKYFLVEVLRPYHYEICINVEHDICKCALRFQKDGTVNDKHQAITFINETFK
jgi:hypothetical protein